MTDKKDTKKEIEDLALEFAKDLLDHKSETRLTTVRKGEYFCKFIAAKVILPRAGEFNSQKEKINEGCFGESGDLGLDYGYKIADDHYILMQTKLNFPGHESLDRTQSVIKRIVENPSAMPDKMADFFADCDFENTTFETYFVSAEHISDEAIKKYSDQPLIAPTGHTLSADSTLKILNGEKVMEKHDMYLNGDLELPEKAINLKVYSAYKDQAILFKATKNVHLCITDGLSIKNAARHNPLFSFNIREGLGTKREVNKLMKMSIIGDGPTRVGAEPENFLMYNNGLTIICESAKLNKDYITVSQMQIINGAQTSTTLKNIDDSNLTKLRVQAKIIEVGDLKVLKDITLINKIVKYSNSQTAIKLYDFLSNEKFQRSIENWMNGQEYCYGGKQKSVEYVPKRRNTSGGKCFIQTKAFVEQIVPMLYPAKRVSESEIWNLNAGSIAFELFGDKEVKGELIWKSKLNDNEMSYLAGLYWLSLFADKIMSDITMPQINEKKERGVDGSTDLYFTFFKKMNYLRAVHLTVCSALKDNENKIREFYSKFSKCDTWFDKDNYPGDPLGDLAFDISSEAEIYTSSAYDSHMADPQVHLKGTRKGKKVHTQNNFWNHSNVEARLKKVISLKLKTTSKLYISINEKVK